MNAYEFYRNGNESTDFISKYLHEEKFTFYTGQKYSIAENKSTCQFIFHCKFSSKKKKMIFILQFYDTCVKRLNM